MSRSFLNFVLHDFKYYYMASLFYLQVSQMLQVKHFCIYKFSVCCKLLNPVVLFHAILWTSLSLRWICEGKEDSNKGYSLCVIGCFD